MTNLKNESKSYRCLTWDRGGHNLERRASLPIIALIILGSSALSWNTSLGQVSDNGYTDVGNIGLAITSFGKIGNEFDASFWPAQPSCEYPFSPVRSRIEHLFSGGLWIGGYKNGQGPFVSTATTDYYSSPSEFTQPLDVGLTERSSLPDSRYYSPTAVSHQDFVSDFTDSNTVDPGTGQEIVRHHPLNVSVHEEAYAWQYPIADFFVVLSYRVTNTGTSPIDSMFVGFVNDFAVRNTNYRLPTEGTPFYSGTGLGYVDSLRLVYAFDAEHHTSDMPTDNYVALKLLGVDPLSSVVKSQPALLDSLNSLTHFSAWQFRSSTGDANLLSPGTTDAPQFEKMETSLPSDYYNNHANPSYLGKAGNRYTLLSVGPMRLLPDSSVTVAFAIVCAPKSNTGNPDDYQNNVAASRKTLCDNATWAQRTYNGDDRNGNGVLDPGEDMYGDGKIHRYIFPNILPPPHIHVVPGDREATIYWDDTPENVIDPLLNRKNFEGYRLYKSKPGYDFQGMQNPYEEIAEFDLVDSIGLDAGLPARLSPPKEFPAEPYQYVYRYTVPFLLNGWQYLFGVEAYDKGDPTSGTPSQTSVRATGKVFPGSTPANGDSLKVGVFPNPYYTRAVWDGTGERERKIYFYNLPAKCEIRIYTIAGDIVATLEHNAATYTGSDIQWYQHYDSDNSQRMPGGLHAWDLITSGDQAIATGLYLFTVKNLDNGNIQRGKFLVIK
ncbi:MAG: hypothetical protein M1339_06960 [Bacteroidetes bacterium]|nr:hypothetical protein [Bacteroidota bacterium]